MNTSSVVAREPPWIFTAPIAARRHLDTREELSTRFSRPLGQMGIRLVSLGASDATSQSWIDDDIFVPRMKSNGYDRSVNPWVDLPIMSPYVLPGDAATIAAFNATATPHHVVHLEILPEPYLGDPNSPVVLLNMNPGYVHDDRAVHLDRHFNDAARLNLVHEHSAWPLYLLNPSLPDSPGREWWRRKLSALITALGSAESVASSIFVAEVHGYHSRRFHRRLRIPSQQYTFALVRAALERRAHIVLMRGRSIWLHLIPELATAPFITLRNPQNPTISPRNCPEQFDAIVRAIRNAA